MATAAELRQILKEDSNGQNLYDHLTQTLMKILVDRPSNAFETFELISADVKAQPLQPAPHIARSLPLTPEQLEKQLQWMNRCSTLLKVPDEPPEDPSVKLPELLDDLALYEWAGVSFGRSDIFRLHLALKKFVEKAQLPSETERLRFVGRFATRGLPYFIVEGLASEDPENMDERLQEGRIGANKFVYFVSQSLESDVWVKLPNVTSEQIVKVRQFRRLLTGDLEAAVPSYPPFPGQEKHLLRAMLANIVHDTSISPDGFFDLDDSDPPMVKAAEAEQFNERFPKPSSDLKELENWKHHETPLNVLGRVTAMPEQTDESGEVIPAAEDIEIAAPLDTIKPELWTSRVCPGGAGATSNSAVVVRSLRWPGASAVAAGRRFVNIYVGNGLPAMTNATTYSPPLVGPIMQEFMNAMDAAPALVEQADTKVDPTPPVAEEPTDE
jgi:radial spoke head protein 4A